jgi:Phage tail lysozyme
MRYVLKGSADLHSAPNPTAPSSSRVDFGDQLDVDGDIANKDFVKGDVVEPPPRRSGFVATAALEPLPPPGTDIDAMGFYTYLYISTVGTGADQRYLFALAFAESGLKNQDSAIAGSDGFGPFQYSSARWTELLASVGVDAGLQAKDREDPFAQATLAIREEMAALEAAHAALLRPVQHNELYLLHLLPSSAATVFLNAVKNAPTTLINAIQGDAAKLSEHLKRDVQTIAEALDAAAVALQTGLDKTAALDPPPAPAVPPIANAGAITRTLPLAKKALARLLEAGWSNAQSCGIIANIQAESGFNFKNDTGDGGKAYGLCQWHEARRVLFEKRFGHPMKQQSTFEQQIDYITFEMNQGDPDERKAGTSLAFATTPSDAADKVCRLYERPLHPEKDSPVRMGLAEAYARLLG